MADIAFMPKSKARHWYLRVPIFEVNVYLVMAESLHSLPKKFEKMFAPLPEGHDAMACVRYGGGNFGLFFEPKALNKHSHGLVAHEIFHLTHRIMEHIGQEFAIESHESHALLCEWLTKWVYEKIYKVDAP